MSRNIGGALDMAALAKLHFHSLSRDEQAAAIRRFAATGQSEHTISHATGLSVEMVRQVIGPAGRTMTPLQTSAITDFAPPAAMQVGATPTVPDSEVTSAARFPSGRLQP